jgi:excisionase family DNA binding protein
MEEEKIILISPDQACKILGVGKNRMYDLLKRYDFPSFSIGHRFYINKYRLQEWIDKQCKVK